MAIVPSGKVRVMQAQQMRDPELEQTEKKAGPGATQTEFKAAPAAGQQAGQPEGNTGGTSPAANLQQQLSQQKSQPPAAAPNLNALQQAVNPGGKNTDEEIKSNIEKILGFKQAFLKWITDFGIDTQLITRDKTKRKMMEQMFNIDPTVSKGRVEVPGWYTDPNGQRVEVSYTDAFNALSKMARQYDFKIMPSKMNLSSDTYVFDVVSASHGSATPNVSRNGLEAVYAPEGGEQAQQQKAASTQSELIKEGKSELLEALLKIGLEKP
jgi:hypothetical protein